ncbi:hypothetical protein PISL3812_02796 [Talaromyces islandicus]|uniref:HTH CENPB-type domain-containing protein n=1 Tax=Talaromyces islandicus TaxID=28573 RepID=A0A0U1LQV2_TALIS|nr:hypothetical protein PISL3812_02796 [Talaromyces islandicus]
MMDTDAPSSHESDYTGSPWVDMGAFEPAAPHHSPPLPDFHGFSYGSPPIVPMEPAYSMSVPPPYSTLQLTMPSHPWPSMLTTQSSFPEAALSPAPAPTLSIPQPVPIRPSQSTPTAPTPPSASSVPSAPTPRRTLTDEDRRRMCQYHEENKSAKQTDIGGKSKYSFARAQNKTDICSLLFDAYIALFGVERSTVSKVLRQKEKYLSMEDGSRSPIKKSKGKVPDIEKALVNWAKNFQRQGHPLTDAMIKEKAHFFATTCGSTDGKQKVLTTSWLEKFKRKNNLVVSKSRKGSVDTVVSEDETTVKLPSQASSTQVSPISPVALAPSPLSPTQSQETVKKESIEDLAKDYKHSHSQSTTSLDTAPSLSASVASPTSPLLSESPYTPSARSRLPSISSATNRRRSQTLPLALDADALGGANGASDQMSSKNTIQASQSVAVFDSPLEEDSRERFSISDDNVVRHNRSTPDIKTTMQPPPLPKSSTVSPISSPSSPTQDEARRALELVMNFFQNQPSGLGLQAQDYITMGKLMEKLELAQNQTGSISGRLQRIDEHGDSPRVNKKRSIHSLT